MTITFGDTHILFCGPQHDLVNGVMHADAAKLVDVDWGANVEK